MATQQNDNIVKILLSKENNCLVIEYSVTPTNLSEYCQIRHTAIVKRKNNGMSFFKRRTKVIFGFIKFKLKPKVEGNGTKLRIDCGIEFQVGPTGSFGVKTLKKEDADALKKYFFKLESWVITNGDPHWPWAFSLNEAYDLQVWEESITPKVAAGFSAGM
jgi:hypothetical protein